MSSDPAKLAQQLRNGPGLFGAKPEPDPLAALVTQLLVATERQAAALERLANLAECESKRER
jgi:hypothetical protein